MKKEEFVKKYGKVGHEKMLKKRREWVRAHFAHTQIKNREHSRKGGKYYEKVRCWGMNGIPHARGLIRAKQGGKWRPFKKIIAPDSQLHHEWVPGTADYKGMALVEKDQHMHGFIGVIQILEGEITLFTEAEIRRGV